MQLYRAESKARELMNKHGLIHWLFEFNQCKTIYGQCSYRKQTIYLSEPLTRVIVNDDDVIDTILHEIAHALVGRGHGHDLVWKRKAREIGARPDRCAKHVKEKELRAKYEAKCPNCGIVHKLHRRSKRSHWCKCERRRFRPEMKLNYVQNF